MILHLVQSLSLAGDPTVPNDDRAGHTDRVAWVIDGATDLGPPGLVGPRGGAAWLAQEADLALAAAAEASLDAVIASVADHLGARFAAVRTREPQGRWELPIAAMLAARIEGGSLATALLGDCVGILAHGERVTRFGALEDSREAESAAAAQLGAGVGAKGRSPEILERARATRGLPDKRVLGVDPATARPILSHLPVAPGDDLLLMTDGVAALVDTYAEFDAAALVAAMRSEGLAALAGRLRQIEADDAACRTWPRFKASDDATALWLRVS